MFTKIIIYIKVIIIIIIIIMPYSRGYFHFNNLTNEQMSFTNSDYVAESVESDYIINGLREENTFNVCKLISYSNTIKFLSILDFILIVIYGIYYFPLFVLVFLPYMGYKGANKFESKYMTGYLVYNILFMIFRCILIYYVSSYPNDNIKLSIIFLSVCISINLWTIWIISRFYHLVNILNHDELSVVRTNNHIFRSFVLFY